MWAESLAKHPQPKLGHRQWGHHRCPVLFLKQFADDPAHLLKAHRALAFALHRGENGPGITAFDRGINAMLHPSCPFVRFVVKSVWLLSTVSVLRRQRRGRHHEGHEEHEGGREEWNGLAHGVMPASVLIF